MRALVTGAAGFVGAHLCRHLVDKDDAVAAFVRPEDDDRPLRDLSDRLHVILGDVTDPRTIRDAIAAFKPDVIYHLAGFAFVPDGESDPAAVMAVNLNGTIHIAEAVLRSGLNTRVVFAGSGEVYGGLGDESPPFTEDDPPRPLTLYAHSKWFAERMLLHYRRQRGVSTVALRLFNHIGPGQSPRFSIASFVEQIRGMKTAGGGVIHVGNLEARRDFTDVRDVVRAYRSAGVAVDPPAVVNICTGRDRSIREVLNRLVALSGLNIDILIDPSRVRSLDMPRHAGNNTRAHETLDWRPEIPLETTLTDWLDDRPGFD